MLILVLHILRLYLNKKENETTKSFLKISLLRVNLIKSQSKGMTTKLLLLAILFLLNVSITAGTHWAHVPDLPLLHFVN